MTKAATSAWLICGMGFFAAQCHAQNQVIPQVVDGGGWQTTIVVTNTTANTTSVSLSFFQETGGTATQAWNPPFLDGVSTQNLSIPAAATLFLHTAGAASDTTVGWVQVQASSAVVAYAIFTQRNQGRQDQDGTAEASSGASRVLVPFDNANGFVTSIAIVNPTGANESVGVGIQPVSGLSSHPSSIQLLAQGHTAFAMPDQFPTTIGQRGLLEFYVASGSISVLALRFNPTGAFTTAPVYPQTGLPIIPVPVPSSLPSFSMITIHAASSGTPSPVPGRPPLPQLGIGQITVLLPTKDGNYMFGQIGGVFFDPTGSGSATYVASWNNVAVSGNTLTFTALAAPTSYMLGSGPIPAQINPGTLVVSLSPPDSNNSGVVSGSINLVSVLATVSGTFSGTYMGQ